MATNAIRRLTNSFNLMVAKVGATIQAWLYELGADIKDLDRVGMTKFKNQLTASIGDGFDTRLWSTWSAAAISLQRLRDAKLITEKQATDKVIGSLDSLSKIKSALDPTDPVGYRSEALKLLRQAKKDGGTSDWLTFKVAEEIQKGNSAAKPTNQGNKNGGSGKGKGGNTKNGGKRKSSPKVTTDALVKQAMQSLDALNKRLATDTAGGVKHADVIRNGLANTARMVMNCEETQAEAEAAQATA